MKISETPTMYYLICQSLAYLNLAVSTLIFVAIGQKVVVEDPLRLQGCAHTDTREIQGVSLPLRNVQTRRLGTDKLFSVKGQIPDVIDNEGHMVCVPICVKLL